MVWKIETQYIANSVLVITELQFTQFKCTSEHSELRLLNQQQRKVRCEGKPGLVVMGFGQDMKHQKEQVGSEYVMAYCVLHFIPDGRKIISQLL